MDRVVDPNDMLEKAKNIAFERIASRPEVPVARFEIGRMCKDSKVAECVYYTDVVHGVWLQVMQEGGTLQRATSFLTYMDLATEILVDLKLETSAYSDWNLGIAALNTGALFYRRAQNEDDYHKARHFYEISESYGVSQAAVNLGYIWQYARGVVKNEITAYLYFSKGYALDKSNPQACYKFGDMFYWGGAAVMDKKLGLKLFEEAHQALLADPERHFDVAYQVYKRLIPSYLKGYGTAQNYRYVLELCHEARMLMLDYMFRMNGADSERMERLLEDAYQEAYDGAFASSDLTRSE